MRGTPRSPGVRQQVHTGIVLADIVDFLGQVAFPLRGGQFVHRNPPYTKKQGASAQE